MHTSKVFFFFFLRHPYKSYLNAPIELRPNLVNPGLRVLVFCADADVDLCLLWWFCF